MIGPSHFGRGLKKTEFTPPSQAGPTRNSVVLEDFVAYCRTHPQLRFWQALLNWSGLPFIVKFGTEPVYVKAVDESGRQVEIEDTYNWEGKNG